MTVHVVFRSYGGENRKDRPDYYGKTMALASCVRAAEAAGVEILFFNDGPVPDDRMAIMRTSGEVRTTARSVGMRRSYLGALRWAVAQPWPDEDVVWFSEDDYAYAEDAFVELRRIAEQRPDTTYFALYGSSGTQPPAGWEPSRIDLDGQRWVQIDSTASTFGVRLGALRADIGIFRLCMLPHRNMYRDHDTCLVYQGFEPHLWSDLLRDLLGFGGGSPGARMRRMWLAPFLMATNVRSHRRRANRRTLLAITPNRSAHLENALIPPGRDWSQVAQESLDWLEGRPVEAEGAAAVD